MVRTLIAVVVSVVVGAAPASAQTLSVSRTSQCVSLGPGNGNKVIAGTRVSSDDPFILRSVAGLMSGHIISCTAGSSWNSGTGCKIDGGYVSHTVGERITFINGNWNTYHQAAYGDLFTTVASFQRTAVCPDIAVCNSYGCSTPANSPIIVPTERLAKQERTFTVSDVKKGVPFDIDGDGVIDLVGWPDGGAAFLAIDHNGNGVIDNGKELLGTANGYDNGFAELKARATAIGGGGEARIDATNANAPLFLQLLLWEDRNRNGATDQGELRPASELLTAVGLGWFGPFTRLDEHGNDFRYEGWAEYVALKPRGPKTDPTRDIFTIWDVFLVQQ